MVLTRKRKLMNYAEESDESIESKKIKKSIKSSQVKESDQASQVKETNEHDQDRESNESDQEKSPKSKKSNIERLSPDQLPDFIYEQYLEKKSKTEIFNYACQRLGYKKRPTTRLNEWFDAYERTNGRSLNGNISENCQNLIKLIHIAFNPSVQELIQTQIAQNGKNRFLSFKNVCERMRYPFEESTIPQLFQRFETNDETLKDEIGNDQFELIQKINYEYVKEKNFLFKCDNVELEQCRYTFQLVYNESNLVIKDCFYDQQKTLTVKNALLKARHDEIKFQLINSSYLLIIENFSYPSAFSLIQLAKFDLESEVCEVVDEKSIPTDQYQIVKDSNNSNKFMLISSKCVNTPLFVLFGDLKTNKFTSKHTISIKNQDQLCCLRLIDNKLTGLKFNENRFSYWETEFKTDVEEIEGKELFKFEYKYEHENFSFAGQSNYTNTINNFVWIDNVCYILFHINYYTSNLYSFDVNHQKYTLINFASNFNFRRLYLRDDDCLMCQENTEVYCFPLNKPARLEYTTWFSVKKQSSKNENIIEHAKKALPLNSQFRPFYIKNNF